MSEVETTGETNSLDALLDEMDDGNYGSYNSLEEAPPHHWYDYYGSNYGYGADENGICGTWSVCGSDINDQPPGYYGKFYTEWKYCDDKKCEICFTSDNDDSDDDKFEIDEEEEPEPMKVIEGSSVKDKIGEKRKRDEAEIEIVNLAPKKKKLKFSKREGKEKKLIMEKLEMLVLDEGIREYIRNARFKPSVVSQWKKKKKPEIRPTKIKFRKKIKRTRS